MAHAFKIKQHDRLPAVSGVPRRESDGAPVNLASPAPSGIHFAMRPVGAAAPVVTGIATVTDTVALGLTDPGASQQRVAYHWALGETATLGNFEAEFEIRYPASQFLSIPNGGAIPVRVGTQVA